MNIGSRRPSHPPAQTSVAEEDRELLERAQAGDKLAFQTLVQRHERRALMLARGLVRNEQDARELVQEAFLRAYRGLSGFQGGAAFYTWMYRIITNLAIDLHRKPSRKATELRENDAMDADPTLAPFPGAMGGQPADILRRREIAARLEAALDTLPPYHRAVIIMRELEGLSYEEMAEAMKVSKGTIMSRLFHARQKMQRALADCYEEQFGAPAESTPLSAPGGVS